MEVGICALQPDDLLDPNTATGSSNNRVNYATESSQQEQQFQHKKYELFLERFLDIQVGKLLDNFVLSQHHSIVGLSRLEINHMTDDEVYPKENN